MNRFYVPKKNISTHQITVTEPTDFHHLVHVLRLRLGDELCVSDGEGAVYDTQVSALLRQIVVLDIKKKHILASRDPGKIHITMAVAVPKNAHFEDIVDKLTQLGVDTIIPLFTERTLVQKDSFDKRRDRLFRILFSAAKQSGISVLPELKESADFVHFIKSAKNYDCCLLPNLSHRSKSLKKAVSSISSLKKRNGTIKILALIGPEGDFTKKEIVWALKAGCQGISLGESVLRVDTAAIAVASFLKLYF